MSNVLKGILQVEYNCDYSKLSLYFTKSNIEVELKHHLKWQAQIPTASFRGNGYLANFSPIIEPDFLLFYFVKVEFLCWGHYNCTLGWYDWKVVCMDKLQNCSYRLGGGLKRGEMKKNIYSVRTWNSENLQDKFVRRLIKIGFLIF